MAWRRQCPSEICRARALKCNITRLRSPARRSEGEAKHSSVRDATEQHSAVSRWKGPVMRCSAMAWRRDTPRANAKALLRCAKQRQRVARMRRGVAKPWMAGALLCKSRQPKRDREASRAGREPGRGHAGLAEGPDLRQRAAGGDGKRAARVSPAQHRGRKVKGT